MLYDKKLKVKTFVWLHKSNSVKHPLISRINISKKINIGEAVMYRYWWNKTTKMLPLYYWHCVFTGRHLLHELSSWYVNKKLFRVWVDFSNFTVYIFIFYNYICVYIYIYMCVCVCVWACVCACVRACVRVWARVCMHAYVRVFLTISLSFCSCMAFYVRFMWKLLLLYLLFLSPLPPYLIFLKLVSMKRVTVFVYSKSSFNARTLYIVFILISS
mgnify:CR=1 FL=1